MHVPWHTTGRCGTSYGRYLRTWPRHGAPGACRYILSCFSFCSRSLGTDVDCLVHPFVSTGGLARPPPPAARRPTRRAGSAAASACVSCFVVWFGRELGFLGGRRDGGCASLAHERFPRPCLHDHSHVCSQQQIHISVSCGNNGRERCAVECIYTYNISLRAYPFHTGEVKTTTACARSHHQKKGKGMFCLVVTLQCRLLRSPRPHCRWLPWSTTPGRTWS